MSARIASGLSRTYLLTYGRSVKKLAVPAALYLRLRRAAAEPAPVSQTA